MRNSNGVMARSVPSRRDRDRVRIQLEAVRDQDRLVLDARPVAAQLRAHARHELPRGEGLDDVVIRARVQADDLVGVAGARGEEDDRDAALLTQSAADLDPVHAGQHHVEHHEVRLAGTGRGERRLTVAGGRDPMALAHQVEAQQVADLGVVVDDEDMGHRPAVYDRRVTGP